jgi:hypothetical protein
MAAPQIFGHLPTWPDSARQMALSIRWTDIITKMTSSMSVLKNAKYRQATIKKAVLHYGIHADNKRSKTGF